MLNKILTIKDNIAISHPNHSTSNMIIEMSILTGEQQIGHHGDIEIIVIANNHLIQIVIDLIEIIDGSMMMLVVILGSNLDKVFRIIVIVVAISSIRIMTDTTVDFIIDLLIIQGITAIAVIILDLQMLIILLIVIISLMLLLLLLHTITMIKPMSNLGSNSKDSCNTL